MKRDEEKSKFVRSSLVAGDLFKRTNLSFSKSELLALFVDREISIPVSSPERFVSRTRVPEVARQIGMVTRSITQEESSLISRIAPKQPSPVPGRPIYQFKPSLTSRLDIELP